MTKKSTKPVKPRLVVTQQLRDQVIKERAAGAKLTDLAIRFSMSKTTVDRILRGGKFPSEVKRDKGRGLSSPRLDNIRSKIAELKIQEADEIMADHKRKILMAYCTKNQLTRADIKFVHDQMPLTRVTRKAREARIAKEKGSG